MNKQEKPSSPAPVQRLVGRWIPIDQYDRGHSLNGVMETLFYHPKYRNNEGRIIGQGYQIIRWPGVPYTHYYLLPEPPNA